MAEGSAPERAPHSAFERQYDAGRREYEVFGGTVDARILRPETVTDTVPVILAPGYGETQEVFKKSAETVFNSGRPVIILDHPRRASVFDKETLSQIGEENDMPIHELRKAATLLHILDEEGIKQADAIAHSEAAINVALAATLAPDKFRDVVLSNPAGLIGPDKALRLIARNVRKDARNILQTIKGNIGIKTEVRALTEGGKYIVSNLNRSLRGEVREISQAEIEDMLHDLHDNGMGIVVVAAVDDRTFKMDKMAGKATRDEDGNIVDITPGTVISDQISHGEVVDNPDPDPVPEKVLRERPDLAWAYEKTTSWSHEPNPAGFVDGFISVAGGHDDLHANPDKYTKLALHYLTALNDKRRTERESADATPPAGEWEKLKRIRTKREAKAKKPNIRTRWADKRTISGDYWLKARAESGNYPGLEKNEITDE